MIAVMTVVTVPVSAQNALSDEQRSRVKANCLSIKNTLTQLRASDALLRINRGQVYESLGTKLMARFNARLGGNAFDVRGLTSIAKSYDERLTAFRTDYDNYARQMESVLKIDCTKDPDAFHYAVLNARSKRQILYDDVVKLHALISDYQSSVNDFRSEFLRVSGGNS